MEDNQKLQILKKKLSFYEEKLAREMKGYKGVRHESAASEIKHDTVMVLRAMVDQLKEEIRKLSQEIV